jgi:hypothetical protein
MDAVRRDAADPCSKHDIGGNIMPLLRTRGIAVYDFADNDVPERPTAIAATGGTSGRRLYYEAHLDHSTSLIFNLQLRLADPHEPAAVPARRSCTPRRTGMAVKSMVSPGAIVSGGSVRRSVLARVHALYAGWTARCCRQRGRGQGDRAQRDRRQERPHPRGRADRRIRADRSLHRLRGWDRRARQRTGRLLRRSPAGSPRERSPQAPMPPVPPTATLRGETTSRRAATTVPARRKGGTGDDA